MPELVHIEDLTRDGVRSCDMSWRAASFLSETKRKSDASSVDQIIGNHGADDFPRQTMLRHERLITLTQRPREVLLKFLGKVRIIWQLRR